jgi:hypothetical protein
MDGWMDGYVRGCGVVMDGSSKQHAAATEQQAVDRFNPSTQSTQSIR